MSLDEELKKQYAADAREANHMAHKFAALALLSGMLGLEPAAYAYAIAAAVYQFTADQDEDLAADPPRDDYGTVSRFSPDEAGFTGAGEVGDRILNRSRRANSQLAQALWALRISFERLQGARRDLVAGRSDPQSLAVAITRQRKAVRWNAAGAARCVRDIIELRDDMNAEWRATVAALRSRNAQHSLASLEGTRSTVAADLARQLEPAFGVERAARVRRLLNDDSLTFDELANDPFDGDWARLTARMERALRELAGERTSYQADLLELGGRHKFRTSR